VPRLRTLMVVAVIVTAISGIPAATASPATDGAMTVAARSRQRPGEAGIHCQVVLDKLRPGDTSSRVLSSRCARAGQTLVAPRASVPILTI
jgi:hypothetical protein